MTDWRIYQTQFQAEVGPGAGNCYQACIASVLGRRLEDVPNFMEIVDDTERSTTERAWWHEQGFAILHLNFEGNEIPPVRHIVTGKSPRGEWLHSCIAEGSEIVHDPRPEGGGLVDVQFRTFLVPLVPK